jgi:hypothetical protein
MMKRMNRLYCLLPLMLWSLLVSFRGIAPQDRLSDILGRIKAAAGGEVSYDYKLCLKRTTSGQVTDSIRGRIYTTKGRYIDSNDAFFIGRNGDYYCKLDHRRKMAFVYDIRVVQRKFGAGGKNDDMAGLFALPDSLMQRHARITIDSAATGLYRLTISSKGPAHSFVRFDLNRADYRIAGVYTEAEEASDGPGLDYLRTYSARNVQYKVDPTVFNLGRLFTIKAGKVVLAPRYASYKLTQMIR